MRSALLFALCAVSLLSAPAGADVTAKLRIRSPMLGETAFDGLWQQKGKRIRQEFTTPVGKTIVLSAPSENGAFVLQPETKSYFLAQPGTGAAGMPDLTECVGPNATTCLTKSGFRRVGAEAIGGTTCEIWERVSGAGGQRARVSLSRPDSGPMPFLRATYSGPTGDEVTIDVVSVKEGPLSDALFQLPAGYKRRESLLPPGIDPGRMPSREQLDQVMKQLQTGGAFQGLDLSGAPDGEE
jgi:hypothetical protein